MSLGIILEFLAARWYVFLIAPVYVFVMALLGKKTRFERESFQLALIFQVIYLIVYTGSALWLLAVGSAESRDFQKRAVPERKADVGYPYLFRSEFR